MSDIVIELTELATAFSRAELYADIEFFRRYLSDELRFRRASGQVIDKATFLRELGGRGNANQRLEAQQVEVLPHGRDLAVCSMVVAFTGSRGGAKVDGRFRNTRVFVRSDGLWKCAVWFNSVEPVT